MLTPAAAISGGPHDDGTTTGPPGSRHDALRYDSTEQMAGLAGALLVDGLDGRLVTRWS